MSTSADHGDPTVASLEPPCPAGCTIDHAPYVDAVDDDLGGFRIHGTAEDFGPLLSAALYEFFADDPGTYERSVAISTDELTVLPPDQVTPAILRQLAADAAAAADWLAQE